MDLKGKRVLVTGGAQRVGRAISLELAAAGAELLCHYHSSEEAARSLRDEIAAKGGRVHLLREDLAAPGGSDRLAGAAETMAGPVDALVNSAADFFPTPLGRTTEADWDRLFDLNLKAVFFLSQALGMAMKARGAGAIVNIGDGAGEKPWARFLPYSLTKAGIIALTRGLAKALAPEVRVSCVNPGPVLFPTDYSESQQREAVEATLLKRAGDPEDVARAVRFLIESDYVTGVVLPVDGGRSLR